MKGESNVHDRSRRFRARTERSRPARELPLPQLERYRGAGELSTPAGGRDWRLELTERGSIDNLVLQNLITGPVQASLQIKTIGITYAMNYKF